MWSSVVSTASSSYSGRSAHSSNGRYVRVASRPNHSATASAKPRSVIARGETTFARAPLSRSPSERRRRSEDAVRPEQVRYVGTSSQWAHQFADALQTSDRLGLERFQTMQNHYNLVYREEEREMLPLCEREGVGVIPWSPLPRGYLTRPHEELADTVRGEYMENSQFAERIATYRANGGEEIDERVEELADEKGVTMAQIALSWLLHQEAVDAPIVGTTSGEHLEDAVEALDIDVSDSDLVYLEAPYGPVEINGHE